LFAEIYLQHLENTKIYDILLTSKIVGYFRCVDDILILYNENQTNIGKVLNQFNEATPGLSFTLELEQNNKLNFLDLTINRDPDGLQIEIYKKPTTTDLIIPRDSCHPIEHKKAAIRYFMNRIHTYNLNPTKKLKELNTVQQIIKNNKYATTAATELSNKKKKDQHHKETQNPKWTRFTYIGQEIRTMTKLFKNTNVKIGNTTNNNLAKLLSPQRHNLTKDKFDLNGVNQLTCPSCSKKYTGQTGRPFRVRFKEHYSDYKHANNKSKFACL
jgi:hypothetical protein